MHSSQLMNNELGDVYAISKDCQKAKTVIFECMTASEIQTYLGLWQGKGQNEYGPELLVSPISVVVFISSTAVSLKL